MSSYTDRINARLKKAKFVKGEVNFQRIINRHPGRICVVAEGDSWFGYPARSLNDQVKSNLIDWICDETQPGTLEPRFNMLRLETNGDEAVDMMSGANKKRFVEVLEDFSADLKFILFSAGGNDIVGEFDMPSYLKEYEPGDTALECIKMDRFERKIASIKNAYLDLIDFRNDFAGDATIITHTYDIPIPSYQGGRFLGGLITTDPWIKIYMDEKEIRDAPLQQEIITIMMTMFKDALLSIEAEKFVVIDSQGMLPPDAPELWENEIHPSREGFRRISEKWVAAIDANG